MVRTASLSLVALLVLSSLLLALPSPGRGADVSDARLLNAERDAGNWLMYNRTYAGWRFSPLDQISAANIKKLVPKWIFAGGTVGDQQMTPVVNDGVMFTTSTSLAFNRVHAVNAATGELLWKYDRRTAEDVGALVRLIPHNRGVALYKDKVIFGTLDAHLVALDAKTGKPAWETKIVDYSDGYFVSQAPLVIKGKVVVGIAGPGEMGPRGFVEAFDADTGKSQWRWYSIPAAGERGSETWAADTWKIGGGAVWHTGTYDPATNLLYVGTGNPAPWIADTGKGVETPGLRPTMGGPPVEVCPSLLGGTGWQPKVYNPRTGLLYIPSNEFCMKYGYVPDLTYKKGQLFTGNTTEHFSKTEQAGVLRAFDVNQNKVLWEWNNRTPLISHTLATAGDLVFQGTAEGRVVALDAKSGQELWSFSLGTPQSGGIISYAVDGKQYIAVAAGGTVRSQVWFGKEPKWTHATRLNFSDVVVVFGLSE